MTHDKTRATHGGRRPCDRCFRSAIRSLAGMALVLVSAGCYTFQPVEPEAIGPGQEVRVRVTGAFADSLGPLLQKEDARVVEGDVVSGTERSFLLDVSVNSQLEGIRMETLKQRVEIPRDALLESETKELSKGRTYGLLAVAVAAAAAIVVTQLSGNTGGGELPGGGGPVESVVSPPGVSVPVGWVGALLRR
jgi:hypothetical protein